MRPPLLTRCQSEQALRSPDLSKTAGQSHPGTVDTNQGVIPHATQSAAHVAGNIAEGVKTVVQEAVTWVEHKAEKLERKQDGLGPYSSPATCFPDGLDPLASGVMPALEAERSKSSHGDSVPQNRNSASKEILTESKKR